MTETGHVEFDPFSLALPLPYRVACILVLGVWAWGINLHYLHVLNIDVPILIRFPHRHSLNVLTHHSATYRLAVLLTVPLIISLTLFWALTNGDPTKVLAWEVLPNLYLLYLVLCFLLPFRIFSHNGRLRFLTTLRRIAIGGLAGDHDGRFGDILMADALTSYAKVLGDLFVSLCMFFSSEQSSTGMPNRGCGGNVAVPIIISIPSLIRLRQCLTEFFRVRNSIHPADGKGSQHLANAVKYSSTLPVIVLSAMQRGYDKSTGYFTEGGLFKLWLFFVFLNSFYSFYWDVTKDWNLSILSSSSKRNASEHPWGLRKVRLFQKNEIYYGAIAVDFLLRCTWSFKLSPHLDHFNDLEGGIFLMEMLEVFRRWIWIFLRVETEWIRQDYNRDLEGIQLPEYRSDYVDKFDIE